MATCIMKGKGNGVRIPAPGETVYTGRLGAALKDVAASLEKMKQHANQALEKEPGRR